MADKIGLIELAGDEFLKDFSTAIGVPPEIVRTAAKRINTAEGFDTSDEAVIAVVEETGIPSTDLHTLLRIASYLRKQALKKKVATDSLLDELAKYCTLKGLRETETFLSAFRSLLEFPDAYLALRRRVAEEEEVVSTLRSMSAAQDLRGVFNDEGTLTELVPTLLVSLDLQDPSEKHELVSFQLTRDALSKFIGALEEYGKNLDRLAAIADSAASSTEQGKANG